jgi:hypothetical protein
MQERKRAAEDGGVGVLGLKDGLFDIYSCKADSLFLAHILEKVIVENTKGEGEFGECANFRPLIQSDPIRRMERHTASCSCRDADPTPCSWAPLGPSRGTRPQIPEGGRIGDWRGMGMQMQMQDSCVVQVGETVPPPPLIGNKRSSDGLIEVKCLDG